MKFVLYAIARIAFFLVPFGLMMLMPIFQNLWWLAAIFSALIGLSLSIIFLRKPLTDVTTGMAERREQRAAKTRAEREREEEDAFEDAANEAAGGDERP
ncbi:MULTISPECIES: DUF4229 domain-containing protein [unclassified Microbacterium]|uniref:DUF4229 domain-containing protein n=1 Tax=unclassified Microbacterium TaxID=2609290 RepID=UPI00097EAD58|nr:DUF4229 domain-containing protein [Microbacterium sp. JB110]RCS57841.1 DUF4229 domain-containing protein [Microbacterium sp. JB110]SJM56939.1 hypothetical protein CZ774_08315 [Frigoribacterium sp. JB110]